ncbi:hypothetical protein L226DRAFT_169993 [Lentinus tigrinus ALCF2SS1-7]|uniref:Peptidase A1 domain-containing protein n=1 Tax=Lentinus tigrinus ALCF2SS1-6 TaxID=1328759 RepID=A0A5C2S0A6_9APHY|nr:hypothetical protein L227DRAFT_251865 [Lentinus tigrinus ALCF2SS1-6]RPD71552.1 hypothetical protein L226DRAFT_169993 [Lentinus tigrinus ALCF2SS1-7]
MYPSRNTRAYPSAPWKGKERELAARDGGSDGTVIDLELVQDSPYQAAYVAPVYLGSGQSKHLVQVDTGSSDLGRHAALAASLPARRQGLPLSPPSSPRAHPKRAPRLSCPACRAGHFAPSQRVRNLGGTLLV